MNIIHPLIDHLVRVKFNRMTMLLPELIVRVVAVLLASTLEKPDQKFSPALRWIVPDCLDNLCGCVLVNISDNIFLSLPFRLIIMCTWLLMITYANTSRPLLS